MKCAFKGCEKLCTDPKYKWCTDCRAFDRQRRLCSHNILRRYCKKCKELGIGGSGICEHNCQKSKCKECKKLNKGGETICEHNRRRNRCKECKKNGCVVSQICEHNTNIGRCCICKKNNKGGNDLCEHYREKYRCLDCAKYKNLKGLCEHNKNKNTCKDCYNLGKNLSGFCTHGVLKNYCKDCGGSQICEHSIQVSRCIICKGSQICEHQARRNRCKVCKKLGIGGINICDHYKYKPQCIICTPSKSCKLCLSVYIDSRSKYKPLCFRCFCYTYPDAKVLRRHQLKEHFLRDALKERYPVRSLSMRFDKPIDNGCSMRRPDVLLDLLTHCIIIECDEHQHGSYLCETKRSMQIFMDLGDRPLVVIRFNPDSYKINGNKVDGCFKNNINGGYKRNLKEWRSRLDKLFSIIDYYIDPEHINKEYTEEKLFYNVI